MTRLLLLLAVVTAMINCSYAANDDIALHVKDIITDWGGSGGQADSETNSYTYNQYALNYWDIHDLSTDVYDRLEMKFATPVDYDNIHVTATYSDGTTTESTIVNGATSHNLAFEADKILEKITVSHGWDGPQGPITIYYDSIVIRAKDSTGLIGNMPVKSPKLGTGMANPILDFQFCADPTAIEHDGRLYVYGTNDHQQYEAGTEKNSYEKIKSLVMISTDDMVNWTYHGLIQVDEIAPWILASWAPSIISKKQADGTTLFSLYFSNSGWGVGVIQAKSPVGPWTSPLSKSLIDGTNPVVAGSGAVFDPGAVIDDNGDAWVTFGNRQGWIARLNPDLHSFAADPVKLPSPFHYEANELNFINGTYVYTFNNDWSDHEPWTWGGTKPTACSMVYMKSTNPLKQDSWTYGGNYFKNPGDNGMTLNNNHTHLHKYNDKWYLFYQTMLLEPSLGANSGFRSIYVDEIEVDEQNVDISECIPTREGVSAIKNLDPAITQYAATSAATLGILYKPTDEAGHMIATVGMTSITAPAMPEGIIEVRNVDFSTRCKYLKCRLKGDGSVALRIDDRYAADIAVVNSSKSDWNEYTVPLTSIEDGTHTIYLILKGEVEFDTWQMTESDSSSVDTVPCDPHDLRGNIYDLQGRRLPAIPTGTIYIRNGKKHLTK